MSKQFFVHGGKVIIGDNLEVFNNEEKVNRRIVLSNNIKYLEEEINKNRKKEDFVIEVLKDEKKSNIYKDIFLLGVLVFIMFICFKLDQSIFIKAAYGGVSLFEISTLAIQSLVEYFKTKKSLKGLKRVKEFLEKELDDCKSKQKELEELKSYSIKKESLYNNRVVKMESESFKNVVDDLSKLHFDIGYNDKKYKKKVDYEVIKRKIEKIYIDSNLSDISIKDKTNENMDSIKKYLKTK